MENPYDTLKVSREDSLDEIKSAFRKLAQVHHPDKGGDIEVFKKISGAYTFLLKTHIQRPKCSSAPVYASGKPVDYTYDPETGMWWSPHEEHNGFAGHEVKIIESDEEFQRKVAALRASRIGKTPPPMNARAWFNKNC